MRAIAHDAPLLRSAAASSTPDAFAEYLADAIEYAVLDHSRRPTVRRLETLAALRGSEFAKNAKDRALAIVRQADVYAALVELGLVDHAITSYAAADIVARLRD